MFLSRLFKRKSTKLFTLFGALTMALGVGATISQTVAQKQNEVVETKADTERKVYYAIPDATVGSYTVKINAFLGWNTWRQANMAKTSFTYNGYQIWEGKISTIGDGADIFQFQLYDGGTQKSVEVAFNSYKAGTEWEGKLWVYGNAVNNSWFDYTADNLYTVYLAKSTNYTVKINVKKSFLGTWQTPTMTKTSYTYNGAPIYECLLPFAATDRFQFQLYNGDSHVQTKEQFGSSDSVNVYKSMKDLDGQMFVYDSNSWQAVSRDDSPGDSGAFYLVGNETFIASAGIGKTGIAWRYDTGKAATACSANEFWDYAYKVTNCSLTSGSVFKVRSKSSGSDIWYNPIEVKLATYVSIVDDATGGDPNYNIHVNATASYDIYFYISDRNCYISLYTSSTTFEVSFQVICDGVLQDTIGYFTGSAEYGDTFGDIANCVYSSDKSCTGTNGLPAIPGYTFSGFYKSTSLVSGNRITDKKIYDDIAAADGTKVYARYVASSDSRTVYYCTINGGSNYTSDIVGSCGYAYFTDSSNKQLGDVVWPGVKTYYVNGYGGLFTFTCPSSAAHIILGSGNMTSDVSKQTIDIDNDTSHNLFLITGVVASGTDQNKKTGNWADLVFYLETTVSSNTSFNEETAAVNRSTMSVPSAAKGNKNEAELTGFSPINAQIGRIVAYRVDDNGVLSSYATYGYADTDDARTAACVSRGASDAFFTFTSSDKVNVYLQHGNGRVYMIKSNTVEAYGRLILACDHPASSITFVSVSSSGAQIDGEAISTIADISSSVGLVFDSHAYVHQIPICNLRGDDSSEDTLTVTFTANGSSHEVTLPTDHSCNLNIYITLETIDLSSYSSSSYDEARIAKGTAAMAASSLAAAVNSAPNSSLCNVNKADLVSFKNTYKSMSESDDKAVQSAFTLLSNATISTWATGTNNVAGVTLADVQSGDLTTKYAVSIATIYNYVSLHYNESSGTWQLNTLRYVGKESPLTTTLWIVLGAGMAGLAAIGAAYFVSKKRKRA